MSVGRIRSLLDHLAGGTRREDGRWREWRITPIASGRNNLLYRATSPDADLAVKFTVRDERDRAGREYGALAALRAAGHARTLTAPAALPRPEPAWPPGYALRTLAEVGDLALWAEACNSCYRDMWGHRENTEPATAAHHAELMRTYPDFFNPAGIFLLFAPDASLAGICSGRGEGGEASGATIKVH